MAEIAHAKHPESKACWAREFQGAFAGDGPGDKSGSNDGVKELAGGCRIHSGCNPFRVVDGRGIGCESACASAEEEFGPIKWSVVVHRHFG